MKKIIIGIFAHPDDEAFGVSPTLIKEHHEGAEIHLITLTSGEHGANPDNSPTLGEIRLAEWRRGGELIGATSMHYLGYEDGCLCNDRLLAIASKLHEIISAALQKSDLPIELMSFDFNGISGHIDHIVAARAAALVFYQLKVDYPERMTQLRLRCIPRSLIPKSNIDWLYMDAGRMDDEIDEVIDAREHHETIVEVIRAHHSQRGDGETHIARYGADLGINHFMVKQ